MFNAKYSPFLPSIEFNGRVVNHSKTALSEPTHVSSFGSFSKMAKEGTVGVGVCEGSGVGYGVFVKVTVGTNVLVAGGILVGVYVGVKVGVLVNGTISVAVGVNVGGLTTEISMEALIASQFCCGVTTTANSTNPSEVGAVNIVTLFCGALNKVISDVDH